MHSLTGVFAILALSAPALQAQASPQNWPQFRGPHARGVAEGFATPTTWDMEQGENVRWKTAIPGLSHSSPVIWGDRMFVTTAVHEQGEAELSSLFGSPGYGRGDSVPDERQYSLDLYCLDKNTGEILWQRTAYQGVPEAKRHPKSTQANPTPACSGDRVIASFGSNGIYCYDHQGELLWKRDFGYLNSGAPGNPDKNGYQWGFASSPVIHGDRVFVQCDHEGQSFVAALDLDTGEDIWRTPREENSTWSTPTVHEAASGDRSQLILNGYLHIGGYDLHTGEEIWKLVGGGDVPIPTPVIADGLVFLTSAHGSSRPLRAVSVRARGALGTDPEQDAHLVWTLPRRGIYNQTPIVYGGLLYSCADNGVLACYDPQTGEEIYRQRLGTGRTGFSGSAVAADGKLYFSGENGDIFIVRAGRDFEVIAVNDMGETCMATPAISEDTLYFRTRHHVVAIRTDQSPRR